MLLWAMVGIPKGSEAALPITGRASPPDTRITFLQMTVQHFVAVTFYFYRAQRKVQRGASLYFS